MTEYNLSEILFEIKDNEKLDTKYRLILKNISETGFKNSANIFSISNSTFFICNNWCYFFIFYEKGYFKRTASIFSSKYR